MQVDTKPSLIALAGPNGAGKSTAGPALLKDALGITEFVNADLIAQGLSPFAPDRAAMAAGRIMLTRLRDLARQRATFAFETTLAGRTYRHWITDLIESGYLFHVIFLWLPSPEHAIARVADRVRRGGHDVPNEIVRRRYHGGLRNFFRLYQPLATKWRLYDSASGALPRIVAAGGERLPLRVYDPSTWQRVIEGLEDESRD